MSKIRYGKGFTPRKTGESLQGTELQEREKDKDEKQNGKLVKKNPKITSAY